MTDLLKQLRRNVAARTVLPANRFFTPTERFFETLKRHKVSWIDAGTGSGELPEEAHERGIKMFGVDICVREGQRLNVLNMDAELVPYSPMTWVTICRPSHDGWAADVIDRANAQGAHVYYVGLESNLEGDLSDSQLERIVSHIPGVGEEDEGMWLISPQKRGHA